MTRFLAPTHPPLTMTTRPLALFAGLLLCGTAPAAFGQAGPVGPGGQLPDLQGPISPYIGLLNANNTTAFNYYNFVRPRQRFEAQTQQIALQNRATDRQLSSLLAGQQAQGTQIQSLLLNQPRVGQTFVGTTGHATSFGSTGSYFGRSASGNRRR